MTTKNCEVCNESYDDRGYANSTKCFKCWKASNPNYQPKQKQKEVVNYNQPPQRSVPLIKGREDFRQLYDECVEDAITVLAKHYETRIGDKTLCMEWSPESIVRAAATIFIQRSK